MADPMPSHMDAMWLATKFRQIDSQLRELSAPTGTQQQQLTRKILDQQELLFALQRLESAEFVASFEVSGWRNPAPAAVRIASPTGRVEIEYGGALNSGDGYFCFSVTSTRGVHVSRESVQRNPARRVAVTGGASFSPSGSSNTVVTVPVGVQVVVALEVFGGDPAPTFLGGSISARVAP